MQNVVNFVPRTMNGDMPVSFKAHKDLARALAAQGENPNIFFPVTMLPLRELTCVQDVGLKAVVRMDTNKILAVHGKRYELIKNEDAYEQVEKIIRTVPGLKTDGMMVQDSLAYGGGRTIRSYIFPEHSVDVGKGDNTLLRVVAQNSYDGSCNFSINVGGFRIVCANGMVVGAVTGQYANRHTSSFDPQAMQLRVQACLAGFFAAGHEWKRWSVTPVSDSDALKQLELLANGSQQTLRVLITYWDSEKRTIGPNLWALFNAMTYWATHQGVKATSIDNKSAIIGERERRIGLVLAKSHLFKAA